MVFNPIIPWSRAWNGDELSCSTRIRRCSRRALALWHASSSHNFAESLALLGLKRHEGSGTLAAQRSLRTAGMPHCECPAGTSPNSDSGPDSTGLRAGIRRHFMVRIHNGMSSYHAFIAYQERAGVAPVTESKNVTDLK
jgi:hypothetical protein